MSIPIIVVDAFTDRPFAGNPAAVCLLQQQHDTVWLQSVASEMNLSETAFVRQVEDGFELRWFTPKVEVDLCGHATLAAAHVLWSEGRAADQPVISFHTRSGVLTASRQNQLIELDFPATPPEECRPPAGLLEALAVDPEFVGRTPFDSFVVIESEQTLRALTPDFRQLGHVNVRGIVVTSPSDNPDVDFVSRFFAPAAGVNEDPVTGSAHCSLAPWWARRLGKSVMTGYQASSRGGTVQVAVKGERVILGGQAVTVLRGELLR